MQKNETDSSKPIKNTRVFLNKPKLLTKTFEFPLALSEKETGRGKGH